MILFFSFITFNFHQEPDQGINHLLIYINNSSLWSTVQKNHRSPVLAHLALSPLLTA